MSLGDFENWFLKALRTFKYTGGDYSTAFTGREKSSHTGAKNMNVFGRWDGVTDNLKGYMTASSATKTGALVVSLPDQKDRCFGTWTITSGQFNTDNQPKGTWSVNCESKQSVSGTFVAEKSWHGLGEGIDSNGRNITFYYKPQSE